MPENDYLTLIKQQAVYQCAATIAGLMYNKTEDVNIDKAIQIATQIIDKIYA